MKIFFVSLFFLILTVLQGSLFTTPFFIGAFILYYVITKRLEVFLFAFLCGIILDVMTIRWVGQTSLFFIAFLSIIMLYERKFEIYSVQFVFYTTFVGSFFFLILFGYSYILLQTVTVSVITVVGFILVEQIISPQKKSTHYLP